MQQQRLVKASEGYSACEPQDVGLEEGGQAANRKE
jgi:hypothetical protein